METVQDFANNNNEKAKTHYSQYTTILVKEEESKLEVFSIVISKYTVMVITWKITVCDFPPSVLHMYAKIFNLLNSGLDIKCCGGMEVFDLAARLCC